MGKTILINIDPENFTLEYEVMGVPGAKCKDITSVLIQGEKVVDEHVTNEYYDGDNSEFVSIC